MWISGAYHLNFDHHSNHKPDRRELGYTRGVSATTAASRKLHKLLGAIRAGDYDRVKHDHLTHSWPLRFTAQVHTSKLHN